MEIEKEIQQIKSDIGNNRKDIAANKETLHLISDNLVQINKKLDRLSFFKENEHLDFKVKKAECQHDFEKIFCKKDQFYHQVVDVINDARRDGINIAEKRTSFIDSFMNIIYKVSVVGGVFYYLLTNIPNLGN